MKNSRIVYRKNTEIQELFGPYLEYYGAIYEATTEEK